MMTPSRKPSRATVITASVAIGVFGAGAGLGTVIAIRSNPAEVQVMRLAAGTYHLDDRAEAWASQASAPGDQPVPLSGSDAGSKITNGFKEQRICLTATVDGHAVGAEVAGCAALPILAVAAAAVAPLQRPGNPKNTPPPPPKETSKPKPSAAKPSAVKSSDPAPTRPAAPVQPPAADPGRRAPVQPPPPAVKQPKPPPPPTPTQKITGNISESGSVISRPQEQKQAVITPTERATPRSSGARPSDASRPAQPSDISKPARPSGTLQPAVPSGTVKPTVPSGPVKPTVPPSNGRSTAKPTVKPSGTVKPTQPSGTLKPAQPSTVSQPLETPRPSHPAQVPPAGPSERAGLPSTDPGTDQNAPQTPDGTVLRPATQPLPDGSNPEGGTQLPVFQDPELLRRAYEALGLDKDMRYTDENGVWDLNIAPPGTPPCRNYSTEELRALSATQSGPTPSPGGPSSAQGSPAIPRDSCLWPAFIRWLYAEPEPGQVSNWTKFTGLPQRNLELVLMDPSPVPSTQPGAIQPDLEQSNQTDADQLDPGRPGQIDDIQPDQTDLGQSNRPDAVQPDAVQPDPGRPDPGRPDQTDLGQPDSSRRDSGSPTQPGPGQVEPDPNEYTGR